MINLEYLDNLPKRVGMRKDVLSQKDWWKFHYRSPKMSYWRLRKILLKKYTNKYFNDAYSEFKHKYNVPDGEGTLENFVWDIDTGKKTWRRSFYSYYIDDKGIIREVENSYRKSRPIIVETFDYKEELVHKRTNQSIDTFYNVYDNNLITRYNYNRKLKYYVNPDYFKLPEEVLKVLQRSTDKVIIAYPDEFVSKVISGWKKVFYTYKSAAYKKASNDCKKYNLKNMPKKELTEEEFREILNAKKIKDKAQNDIIMIKKGFDPKTSFRYGQ